LRLQSKIKLYLLLIAIAFLFKCIGIKSPGVEKIIYVKQGVLDLREWNFGIDGPAYLHGEWEYFPEQFDSLSIKDGEAKKFYSIGKDNFKNNSSSSYASFKVKILLPESSPENSLYIKVSSINSAYSLSVKDKVISSLGAVGKSKLDSTPWMGIDIASLPLDSNELELTLQTSDFYSNKNSLGGNLVIGTLKQLETSSNKEVFIGLSLILTIVFILLYNLSQISEKVSIALTISSISTILLLITFESNLLSLFFPISLGKIITEINTVCQFLILVCLAYCYYIISLALKTKWIRVLFNSVFLFFITGIILTNYFILPTIVERSVNFILIFLHLYASFHFFQFGPSSFARIKTYTNKYKSDLDKTLNELHANKKAFDQKIIERSFNMVTYMEKLELQTGEMEKLNELIIHLLEGANIDSVLDEIFTHIMTYYRANIAFLYFLDPETNEFYPHRGITKDIPAEIQSFMSNSRMPVSREAGIAYISYKRKKTIYIENAKTKYTRKKDKLTGSGIPELVSSLYIPVLIRNEFQGIFFLATFNHPLNLNKDKIKFISMFTNQLTAAIQKEKMLKEMELEKQRAEKEREKAEAAKLEAEAAKNEIEAINSLARSINENLELKFIMEKIMNFVEMHYGIKFYSLHILNDNKKKMKLLEAKFPDNVSSEEKRKISQIQIPIQTEEGAFAFICKSKKMVYYKKLDIEKSNEEERQALGNLNISSMVGIPLKVKNEIIGILNFFSPTQLSLSKMHLRTIASLGEQIAGVIHNSSLYKDIKIEKDKSESLLLSILPPKIATELKNTSKVVPIIYESVTILFTDFVGFTKIAESLLPKQLLIELDGYFTFFDFVCEKYNIEKLKTIGDAYMCAGGLPTANKTHALDACLTAMEFRDFALRMQELNSSSKDEMMPWELRIGLHTGPVIGGIVGTTKFAYDVWGDSVNIASRIESSSVPGKINISETTYELVKDFFVCEHRGKVSAKNKGEIRMYFLDRLRPELSSNEDGTSPNEKFHELYAKVKAGESIVTYSLNQLPLAV
jgi:class 3 adenylate cyclase/GAF domain-containing protein